jgi:Flp pilus assembly protein TadD
MIERQGLHREAITQLEDVLRTSKQPLVRSAAYRGLGVAHAQLGERDQAREYFMQAWRLSPDDPSNLFNMSLLETQEAVDKLSRQVSVHPTAQGYLQLGQLLHDQRDLPNAQVAYEKALQLDPNLVEARQALQNLKASND